MVGWHHPLNGHEFEQTPGDSEGQGSLAYCNPWGRKELDTTDRLKNNNNSCVVVSHSYFALLFLFLDEHKQNSLNLSTGSSASLYMQGLC